MLKEKTKKKQRNKKTLSIKPDEEKGDKTCFFFGQINRSKRKENMNKIKYHRGPAPNIEPSHESSGSSSSSSALGVQQSPAVVSLLAAKQRLTVVCFPQSSFSFKKKIRRASSMKEK